RLSLFARRAHCHQGIFDFPEGDQDRLLVLSQGLCGLSLCRPLLKSQDLGVEQWIREAGAYDAERRLIRDETREIRTRDAKYAGEGDFREALRLGDPDPSRRRMEILLHLDDIRAPLEQFRWKARRHRGRQHLLRERTALCNGLGVTAEQHADLVLLLDHLAF